MISDILCIFDEYIIECEYKNFHCNFFYSLGENTQNFRDRLQILS